MPYRLAILETHPIQYKAPWFRQIHEHPNLDLTVFFCMVPQPETQGTGFGVEFQWDVPLLEGYNSKVLDNVAKPPGTAHFSGCDTPGLHSIVKDGGFDAFLVNGWVVKSCIQLVWFCRRHNIPCIVRGESNAMRPRAWWKSVLHRLLLKQYSAFLYIGSSNRDFYKCNGVSDNKLFFAPYCVENDRFANSAVEARENRAKLRSEWGIPPDAVCFLFSGKLIAKKRPMDVLQAIDHLRGKCASGVHVLIVGDGELGSNCKSFAERNSLPVTFAGFINQQQIPNAYAVSDCLVLPSDYGETWGLVVNEAMACGLPAIVSDQVGCHPDLIEQDRTGFVFPCGNIEALACAMDSICKNASRLYEMGELARDKVADYSYSNCTKGILEALSSVVD